jgi:6-pyruvoyltetrahydropterin/6-carboxytetrahydropterin synthase
VASIPANAQIDRPEVTKFEIVKAVHFEAAHYLPIGDAARGHRRLHGHSFRLEIAIRGERTAGQAWVEDLDRVTAALNQLRETLDHQLLNELAGLETPTLENICAFAASKLQPQFPGLARVTISRPSLNEACTLFTD